MRLEERDWDAYEKDERIRMSKSFMALGDCPLAFDAAVESAAHWNRMYREEMEGQRNDIRQGRAKAVQRSKLEDEKIQFLALSIPTKMITVQPLPSGQDLIEAINERDGLLSELAALKRGEFICSRCHLRKDAEPTEGESPF